MEIKELLNTLNSNQNYIKIRQRKNLVICIRLAQNLGFNETTDMEGLILMLTSQLRKNDYYIKKEKKEVIKPYLEFLINQLSKLKEANFNSDLVNTIKELETTKINTILPEKFINKIKPTKFDELFDMETGGFKKQVWKVLEDSCAWKAGIDLGIGKIIVSGKNSSQEFKESLDQKKFPSDLIEYHQEEPPMKDVRDDICIHTGCKIKYDDEPNILQDFRSNFTQEAKDILDKYPTENSLGGTVGLFVNEGERHYLVTAAHNLFPEFSRMSPDAIARFNELVTCAHYDEDYDITMIEIWRNSPHDNGLVIAPSTEWKEQNSDFIYKLGGKTGLTIGERIHV